jgi:hypothetical protein
VVAVILEWLAGRAEGGKNEGELVEGRRWDEKKRGTEDRYTLVIISNDYA